jgi:phage host-nuclease inhibitor protein Gam
VTIGKTTWQRVLELVGDLAPSLQKRFIRTKSEIDKDAIKAAINDGKLDDETRRSIKVDLLQEEQVFYELKSETAAAGG